MKIDMFRAGLLLFFIGFALAFVAVTLPLLMVALGVEGGRQVSVSGGGCVLILFVPICFGVGEAALPLMVLATVLAVALVLVGLIGMRTLRRNI